MPINIVLKFPVVCWLLPKLQQDVTNELSRPSIISKIAPKNACVVCVVLLNTIRSWLLCKSFSFITLFTVKLGFN